MLSNVLNPCIPYFEVNILVCSMIMLSVTTKAYLAKSDSNSANVICASASVISFVRTFFQTVEANSIFEISERNRVLIFTTENKD